MTTGGSETCPICLEYSAWSDSGNPYVEVICPRCGSFELERSAVSSLSMESDVSKDNGDPRLGAAGSYARIRASAWVRETRPSKIHYRDVKELATLPDVPVLDQADRILVALEAATSHPGESINLNQPEWHARCRSSDQQGVIGMSQLLDELGYVTVGQRTLGADGTDPVTISAGGWRRLAELSRPNADSEQAFVAMSFSEELRPVYDEVIAPAIRVAGYTPHRVDDREHSDRIDDEIVAQIRRSRFVVADYTEHKGGVYWEAGFAKGLGLEVIPTCRVDDIDDLHFDIRQYNTICWKECNGLKKRLTDRIVATVGEGPLGGG